MAQHVRLGEFGGLSLGPDVLKPSSRRAATIPQVPRSSSEVAGRIDSSRVAPGGAGGTRTHGRRIMSPLRILAALADQCSSWPFSRSDAVWCLSPSRPLSVFCDPCVQPASRTRPGRTSLTSFRDDRPSSGVRLELARSGFPSEQPCDGRSTSSRYAGSSSAQRAGEPPPRLAAADPDELEALAAGTLAVVEGRPPGSRSPRRTPRLSHERQTVRRTPAREACSTRAHLKIGRDASCL
jgi:hypothetical protein